MRVTASIGLHSEKCIRNTRINSSLFSESQQPIELGDFGGKGESPDWGIFNLAGYKNTIFYCQKCTNPCDHPNSPDGIEFPAAWEKFFQLMTYRYPLENYLCLVQPV